LSRNPTGPAKEDDNFCEEIQDIGDAQVGTHIKERRLLVVQNGTEMEWLGIRRKGRVSVQHHACCFGINPSMRFGDHHLYMIDIVSKDDQPQEVILCEDGEKGKDETTQSSTARMTQLRKRPHYYDKQQQLELVLAAQQLLEAGGHDLQSEDLDEEEECEADSRSSDMWEDVNCLELLQGRALPDTIDHLESKKARRGCSIIIGRRSHCTSRDCWY
jgi:hypothetical protein